MHVLFITVQDFEFFYYIPLFYGQDYALKILDLGKNVYLFIGILIILYLLLDPPLTLFMRASKSILKFKFSGEDGADIREEEDKIDSNELRGAAREE